jgi:cell division septal protein FtsQ
VSLDLLKEARVLPFRRRRFAARRKRRSLAAVLAGPFLGAVAMVGGPAALALWVLTSPRFGLRTVTVEGSRMVSRTWVEEALRPLFGTNLLRLSLAEARARLAAHPWVGSVEARKELPDRLIVSLRERQAVALLRRGAGLFYLDAEGVAFAPLDPGRGETDLMMVSGAPAGEVDYVRALAVANELRRAQPLWAEGLSEVEILSHEDFRLYTSELPFALLVRAGSVAEGSRRLEALLPEIVRRYPRVEAADLRFSRRIVLQPAAAPQAGARDRRAAPVPPPAPAAGARAA